LTDAETLYEVRDVGALRLPIRHRETFLSGRDCRSNERFHVHDKMRVVRWWAGRAPDAEVHMNQHMRTRGVLLTSTCSLAPR